MSEEKERSPVGQTFESWLEGEGLLEETTEHAIKAVISWQLRKAMEERGLSKKAMADLMGTSRSQLDRLLDPESEAITLKSLMRAARLVRAPPFLDSLFAEDRIGDGLVKLDKH